MPILKSNRELLDIVNNPEKKDYVEWGDIYIRVDKYQDGLLSLTFKGENGVTTRPKKVSRERWQDMVLYLSRKSEEDEL